jgi:transcriptional regulator with XRE-family HTH domain
MKVNAEAVKALRLASGESQETLAIRAGLTEPTLNYIERGRTERPRFVTLKKLSEALGVPVTDLVIAENPAERKALELKAAS